MTKDNSLISEPKATFSCVKDKFANQVPILQTDTLNINVKGLLLVISI